MISVFFFVSGFCSLLYQIVWLRLAMGHFGVIAPVLSTVLSVFMLGLGVGSWGIGRWLVSSRGRQLRAAHLLALYGAWEGIAALGACAVPALFKLGDACLTGTFDSPHYLFGSAIAVVGALLIPCIALGATTPTMLAYARARGWNVSRGFSWLYLANLLGALSGTILTPFVLIELYGFKKTLAFGILLQSLISVCALLLSLKPIQANIVEMENPALVRPPSSEVARVAFVALFLTGFVSMACEVLWTRMFTPAIGTTIYAFAGILIVYLVMYSVGVSLYRWLGSAFHSKLHGILLGCLPPAVLLPLFLTDPRFEGSFLRVFGSLALFCILLGWLTPGWVDLYSDGDPLRAGRAYGINVVGCVLGPLVAAYILLPLVGTKIALMILAAGLCVLTFWAVHPQSWRRAMLLSLVGFFPVIAASQFQSLEIPYIHQQVVIRRDYAATVISAGEGMHKVLRVNGLNLTALTPVTKVMAHLPLLAHTGTPHRALMICFGMGTTFRSLLSWNLDTTAVELVPSVRDAFEYYFSDAAAVMTRPEGHVVIDDGRRFLKRTHDQYDIITLDPPPPVECAASGFLYSAEFYDEVKTHLAPNGIVQQWWPSGELKILQSVSRTFINAFPYVRIYRGLGGHGYHYLGSMVPLRPLSITDFNRLPRPAREDLREWLSDPTKERSFWGAILKTEVVPTSLIDSQVPELTDDQPYNEYYFLRRYREHWKFLYAY